MRLGLFVPTRHLYINLHFLSKARAPLLGFGRNKKSQNLNIKDHHLHGETPHIMMVYRILQLEQEELTTIKIRGTYFPEPNFFDK